MQFFQFPRWPYRWRNATTSNWYCLCAVLSLGVHNHKVKKGRGLGSVRSKRYFRLSSAASPYSECQSRRCHCYGRSSSLHIITTHLRCSAAWHARGSHILLPSQMSILVALATFLFFPVFAIAQGLEPVKHGNAGSPPVRRGCLSRAARSPGLFFIP